MPKYALVAFAYLLKGCFDVVGKETGFEHKRVIKKENIQNIIDLLYQNTFNIKHQLDFFCLLNLISPYLHLLFRNLFIKLSIYYMKMTF